MNLDEFEERARAATPGPWTEDDCNVLARTNQPYYLVATVPQEQPNAINDAEFIAACTPERVLALIRVARAAQELFIRHASGTWIGTDRTGIATLRYAIRDLDAL